MTKILLVEDDKSLREIYGVRLLAEGYDIISAGDGEEALAMAIKERPELIVSDVMMPKISGFDMLDILRSTTETKGIKVIMMTALSSEEQRQRGVSLGADRYLVKSQVGIEDVVRTVHEVLADAPVSSVGTPAAHPAPAAEAAAPAAAPAAPTPVAHPAPVAPVPVAPAPAAATLPGVPAAPPTPQPVAPAPLPAPAPATQQPVPIAPAQPLVAPAPVAAAPAPLPAPVPLPAPSALPAPTAPLTPVAPPAPKQTLASRVIEPLPSSTQKAPDFGNLMSQELSQASPTPFAEKPAVQPGSAATNIPPAPPTAVPSGMHFEETPLPGTPQAPAAPVPPAPGAP